MTLLLMKDSLILSLYWPAKRLVLLQNNFDEKMTLLLAQFISSVNTVNKTFKVCFQFMKGKCKIVFS